MTTDDLVVRGGTLVGAEGPTAADLAVADGKIADIAPDLEGSGRKEVRGSGWFVNGDRRHPFSVGDILFVPVGVPHRFEDFTDDFGTWVIFYGPEGGERPREAHGASKGPESPHA